LIAGSELANNLPAERVHFIDFKLEGPMLKDLVFAVRLLAKSPGFVVVAVCSLAIGIGANSAIYTLAHVLLLRPLPVRDANRVVSVQAIASGPFGGNTAVSYPDYADLRDRNRTFEGLVATSYTHLGFQPDRGIEFTIIGVAPESFHGVDALKAAMFVPLVAVENLWSPSPYRKRD
jgi:putative ABC transport system permease protein